MRKEEKLAALDFLARKHPYATEYGHFWKNPFNPRSRGIRWTKTDLETLQKLQLKYH